MKRERGSIPEFFLVNILDILDITLYYNSREILIFTNM